jgi:hypothetical protein
VERNLVGWQALWRMAKMIVGSVALKRSISTLSYLRERIKQTGKGVIKSML